MPSKDRYVEAWHELERIYKDRLAASIGVSNFPQEQLQDVIDSTGVVPVINQIELSPYLTQQKLRKFDEKHGVLTEAWSPLGSGKGLLDDPKLKEIADAHGATPAQVVLAWHRQIGNVVIPKSVTPERIVENWKSLDVRLDDGELKAIDNLNKDERTGPDPAEFHHTGK